jgi:hypothetical protein
MHRWSRHFFYKKEAVKTTWKLRVLSFAALICIAAITQPTWARWIGESLVCTDGARPSDILILENFDPHYVVFERAGALQAAGMAPRALIPVEADGEQGGANPISHGIAEVMARQARLRSWTALPIRHVEPISLNAALQIREEIGRQRVRSAIVVSPALRSRRTLLIYQAVFRDSGTQLSCVSVVGSTRPQRWTSTWHGIENVAEEFLKLQYYRFYVIPILYAGSR